MINNRAQLITQAADVAGDCIVYVMSRDQRATSNHALLLAQQTALKHKLPLLVFFNLLPNVGVRGREHFAFMLAGLDQLKRNLKKKNIPLILKIGEYQENLLEFVSEVKPSALYFDFSPLKWHRQLLKELSKLIPAACYVVDTHNIIPTWLASPHQEFAAHTFRRKVHRNLEKWLTLKEPELIKHPFSFKKVPQSAQPDQVSKLLSNIPAVHIHSKLAAGETAAQTVLDTFLNQTLSEYAEKRNNPTLDTVSHLSPYLHFGQISSLQVTRAVLTRTGASPHLFAEPTLYKDTTATEISGMNTLFEEMIVRKELSDNYCFYNQKYDQFQGGPDWGLSSLAEHATDKREYIYDRSQWEQAQTHDPAWNAAQQQLLQTGKMHGYMRMYWAKKILEWSASPSVAFDTALFLNDHYSLDGGDPNGYVGIHWSITGLHDRPWTERPVFGKVRYMNFSGLKRKFDIEKYIEQWLGKNQNQLFDE